MNEIWTRRLIAGTKSWAEMPAGRREAVKALLAQHVTKGALTAERYQEICGETYEARK